MDKGKSGSAAAGISKLGLGMTGYKRGREPVGRKMCRLLVDSSSQSYDSGILRRLTKNLALGPLQAIPQVDHLAHMQAGSHRVFSCLSLTSKPILRMSRGKEPAAQSTPWVETLQDKKTGSRLIRRKHEAFAAVLMPRPYTYSWHERETRFCPKLTASIVAGAVT